MAIRKKNSYWKLTRCDTPLQAEAYTPETLWQKALEYFEWAETNPLKEEKAFSSGKRISLNKTRAMTTTGFCIFARIYKATLAAYGEKPDFKDTVTKIRDIIYTQKFEAAAAGLLETSFVAREMGLKEHTDITTNRNDLSIYVPDKDAEKQLERLRRKLS